MGMGNEQRPPESKYVDVLRCFVNPSTGQMNHSLPNVTATVMSEHFTVPLKSDTTAGGHMSWLPLAMNGINHTISKMQSIGSRRKTAQNATEQRG